MNLKALMGSGDKIFAITLPVLGIGLVLNILYPSFFSVGGPPPALQVLSIIILIPGVVLWLWSVYLILTRVPRHELITNGPYSLVKHPLYTAVALLVLPWLGFLLDSWLGLVVGVVLYFSARRFAPEEEKVLAKEFGAAWDDYCNKVKIKWL
jgi:protein-S-isoprenylcysteine O-methyltransferase Ste14